MAFAGSEELVTTAEALLGRRLPDAHRRRLIREDGGEVEALDDQWTLYPVQDDTDRRTAARTVNHVVRELVWDHETGDLAPVTVRWE